MKIAVVGGGIFGITSAWKLAQKGHGVDLYEKQPDILTAASGINQYRLHKGFHYPRSVETILLSCQGEKSFIKEYKDTLIDEPIDHFYCIAKENTLTNAKQCRTIWDACNLPYEEDELTVVKKEKIEYIAKVQEELIDLPKLNIFCKKKLNEYGVNLLLNRVASERDLRKYDFTVIALYANNNTLLKNFPNRQHDYQFELCEKPVVKLPSIYNGKSIVILDGPFMCIDPFGSTGMFVMGNVAHAVHHTNIGKFPEIPHMFQPLLNKGIIENPPITNFQSFIESAEEFFYEIERAEHVGSMYTVRAVPPYKEHDDTRPTWVEKINDRCVVLFSGKIGTCVDVANQIVRIVEKIRTS